jgi:hypothetical protein
MSGTRDDPSYGRYFTPVARPSQLTGSLRRCSPMIQPLSESEDDDGVLVGAGLLEHADDALDEVVDAEQRPIRPRQCSCSDAMSSALSGLGKKAWIAGLSDRSASLKFGYIGIVRFANTDAYRGGGTAGVPSTRARASLATVCGALGARLMKNGLPRFVAVRIAVSARPA